jgi:2-haloacid dehalogenase
LPPKAPLGRPSVAVFDLGGVLIDWNPRHLYRKLFADPAEMEEFLASVTTTAWHSPQGHGADPTQATRELQTRFPDKAALIAAFYDRFDEMCEHAFPEMATLVERLHAAGTPLHLLSNAPAFMAGWLSGPSHRRHPFLGRFRSYVVSGAVGCAKPDAAIYDLVCRQAGVEPVAAVLIDDNLPNIEGARAFGMAGVHHRSAEQTVAELRALGFAV